MDFEKLQLFFDKSYKEDDILELLISNERKTNKEYDYIIRKIISQLEVRIHIHKMGPIVAYNDTSKLIRDIYENENCSLYKKIIKKDKEQNDERPKINEKNIIDWIKNNNYIFTNEFTILEIKDYFTKIINELFDSEISFDENISYLKKDIIGNLFIYKYVFCENHKNKDLEKLLYEIRIKMEEKMVSIGDKPREYRDYDLNIENISKNDNNFFEYTTKACDIEESIKNLRNKYEIINKIEDKEEYIEKAVEIFQDFIKIHPYRDGNGRTSRILLDIMLINKNILPPILYKTYYDRFDLDNPSHKYTMEGNITPIIQFIKERIKATSEEYEK